MKTKQELLTQVEKYTEIMHEIGIVKHILKEDSENIDFEEISTKLNKWKEKLSNPKFEVAIIGLEKAGKSTFANALLKNDYLPEAITRCTYTTTTIEASEDKNYAEVTFYTKEEFKQSFNSSCEAIELKGFNYDNLTIEDLEKFLDSKSNEIRNSRHVDDIMAILGEKNEIEKYLNKSIETITNNLKEEIKLYITDETIARAVKSINIKSNELYKNLANNENSGQLKNMILYDVPGFDSPTKFHLEQAKKYLLQSDVVILLISVADKISFTKELSSYLNEVKNEYGSSLKNKLIICGTKFDLHAPDTKDEIDETITKRKKLLINEAEKYGLYNEKNFFMCSSIAYLEKLNILEKKSSYNKISKLGLTDGIDNFIERMREFLEIDAIKELNNRLAMDIDKTKIFLREFKNNHNPSESQEKLKSEEYDIITKYQDDIKNEILKLVDKNKIKDQDKEKFNINEDLKNEIQDKWISQVKISDEKKNQIAISITTTDGIEKVGEFSSKARDKTYKESLELMKNTITKELRYKNTNTINEFKREFLKIFDIGNTSIGEDLNKIIEELMNKYSYDEKSYEPLLDRFLTDIFEIMIQYPLTDNEEGARFKAFEKYKSSIESLLIFDENYNDEYDLNIYERTLVKKILAHYEEPSLEKIRKKLEEYKEYFTENINYEELSNNIFSKNISLKSVSKFLENKKNNLKDFAKDLIINEIEKTKSIKPKIELLNSIEESTSYDEEQEQINKDLDILNDIISNVILKAAMIEKPFINSLKNQIEAIRIDINDKFSEINKFISLNIKNLKREEFNKLENDPITNEKIEKINYKIENVID